MPSGSLTATVIVCTRDRATLLAGCLRSLEQQGPSDGAYEVLVVDSASRDGTAALLRAWADSGRGRRVATVARPGLSLARNTGLERARGDLVLFLDDDARAADGWVAAHVAAHRSSAARGDVVAVGGPIRLEFPQGRPPWLTEGLEHWFSALDHGPEQRVFPPGTWPYGANLSVRRDLALAAGGFCEALGRRGRALLSNEEADLVLRLSGHGSVVWEPDAAVTHLITGERLTRRWVLRRAWAQGPSNVRMEVRLGLVPPGGPAQARREQAALALHGSPGVGRPATLSDALDQAARRLVHLSAAVRWLRQEQVSGRP